MSLHLDPQSSPDPEREDELRANGAEIELRAAERAAWLGTRSLACPECGVPIALSAPVGWDEEIACAFCEQVAPTRHYIHRHGWPSVELIARLG
ncbi:MAG: hypothetical protein ACRDL6_07280 [Solirubrobacterales bacterium]